MKNIHERKRATCLLRLSKYVGEHDQVAAIKSVHFNNAVKSGENPILLHSHAYYELVIVLRGKGIHWLNGKGYSLAPGQVYLITPGEKHCYENFDQLVLQNFMFSRDVVRTLGRKLRKLPGYENFFIKKELQPKTTLANGQIAEFDVILGNIALENQRKYYQNDLLLYSYIGILLSKLLTYSSENIQAQSIHGYLQNAIAYMRQNYYNPIKLKKLAELTHMSPSSFHACFRKEFDTSPIQWLLHLRIQHSMEMLMHTEKSITDVANACGFVDPLYFSRQFRRIVGCTPRVYRQRGQGRIEIFQGKTFTEDKAFLKDSLHEHL